MTDLHVRELLGVLLLVASVGALLSGFPVAFALSGASLIFAGIGVLSGHFDSSYLAALPERIFGIMTNESLLAIPLFIFMGVLLERAKISEELLTSLSRVFGKFPGGLGIAVCVVGAILAASTGVVGATVVTMGLISLPAMLKQGYNPRYSSGVICASGTLGQLIPPSIVLVILGDSMASAHQQAQLAAGNYSPNVISVGDLFVGALIPGLLVTGLFILYTLGLGWSRPSQMPPLPTSEHLSLKSGKNLLYLFKVLLAPFALIFFVLGSILLGISTPTEAAAIGCVGAMVLSALRRELRWIDVRNACDSTSKITGMIFTILIGASVFSLVFRGFGGDDIVRSFLTDFKGGPQASLFFVLAVIFLLGFFLDFFEIIFVVIPIVGPVLLSLGFDPIWLGVLIAVVLQTSFLTPPFGFALFYLRGVAPASLKTSDIYRGILPFVALQITAVAMIWFFPSLATWLPNKMFGEEAVRAKRAESALLESKSEAVSTPPKGGDWAPYDLDADGAYERLTNPSF